MAYLSRQNRVSKLKGWNYTFEEAERKKDEEKLAELRGLWNTARCTNMDIMQVPGREKREKKRKKEYLKK